MAAPTSGPYGTTGTIFDPTGTDANPIGGSWVTNIKASGHSDWKRLSNKLAPAGAAGNAQAYYNSGSYGLDHEVWCELNAKGADGSFLDIYTMIGSPGASVNAYGFEIGAAAGTDTFDLFREFGGTTTFPLTTQVAQEVAAGDYVALSVRDNGSGSPIIRAWYWALAGSSWSNVISFTDTSGSKVTAAGLIGLEATNNSAWRLSTLMGGAIGGAAGAGVRDLALTGAG